MSVILMQHKAFESYILIQNIDKIAYIWKADLKVRKLNINDEATTGSCLKGKSKVIGCAKQFLITCIKSNKLI